MSDCDRPSGLSGIPSMISNWQREFVSGWVDQARDKGYANVPDLKSYIDSLESAYHTAPVGAGKSLEDAVRSGERPKIDNAVQKFKALSATDKLEAACTALNKNELDRHSDPNLPLLQVVTERTNDGPPQFKAIKVSSMTVLSESPRDKH